MKNLKLILFLISILIFISCNPKEPKLDGIWKSIGYGQLLEINGNQFSLFEVTDISCLPILEGDISTQFNSQLDVNNDTLSIKYGINTYYYLRSNNTPSESTIKLKEKKKKSPMYNLEVLANNFKDHYVYFETRGINWDKLYTDTKRKITTETTELDLYLILKDMLKNFNDGHVEFEASDSIMILADKIDGVEENTTDDNKKYISSKEIRKQVAKSYLSDKISNNKSRVTKWGLSDKNIGYIQINAMMGHAYFESIDSLKDKAYWDAYFDLADEMTDESFRNKEIDGLNKTLDSAFKDLYNTDAIILDVRFNGGGFDEIGMEIMRRFNPIKHEIFTKKAKHGNGFTKINHVYLERIEKAYTNPVYLLTSKLSASATEIMVLSSLNLKHITRIGGATEGVFSDMLSKTLPNGWMFSLSNEVYLDNKGNNYEGKGFPVHIDLEYPEERQALYRHIMNDLEYDKHKILEIISNNKR